MNPIRRGGSGKGSAAAGLCVARAMAVRKRLPPHVSLVTCAAAPSLFYADWIEHIPRRLPAACGIARRVAGTSRCQPLHSRTRAPTALTSRQAHPTATKRRRAAFAAADKLRSLRAAGLRGCGRRRSCRGDSGGPGPNNAGAARGDRRPRQGRAPTARAAPGARSATPCRARGYCRSGPEIASSGSAKSLQLGGGSAPCAANWRLGRSQPDSGDCARVISSGLMPAKKLYCALCSRTWSRHRKRHAPGPSKSAGWSGALNSPGSPHPGTAQRSRAPSTRPWRSRRPHSVLPARGRYSRRAGLPPSGCAAPTAACGSARLLHR